jgi:membrane dipeptidase
VEKIGELMVEILQADKLHKDSLVIDAHSDIPIDVLKRRQAGERRVLNSRHIPEWKLGGIDALILTVSGDEFSNKALQKYTLDSIRDLKDDILECKDDLALAFSARDLVQVVDSGRVALMMNIEGSKPLESSLENLEIFFHEGIRFMTLTWNSGNEVGTGVGCDPEDGGLTKFGREVVSKMSQLGIIIDLSHSSPKTFWDTINMGIGNIVATHSNAAALFPHVRNLTDGQLRAIAEQDGIVGVCFYPGFLTTKKPTVDHIIDHIAYIGDLIGLEHVSIGADYIYFAFDEIVSHLQASGINYGNAYIYPDGVETAGQLTNLTRSLIRRGFLPDDIRNILGRNILRVMQRL